MNIHLYSLHKQRQRRVNIKRADDTRCFYDLPDSDHNFSVSYFNNTEKTTQSTRMDAGEFTGDHMFSLGTRVVENVHFSN